MQTLTCPCIYVLFPGIFHAKHRQEFMTFSYLQILQTTALNSAIQVRMQTFTSPCNMVHIPGISKAPNGQLFLSISNVITLPNIDQTSAQINANKHLFVFGIMCIFQV